MKTLVKKALITSTIFSFAACLTTLTSCGHDHRAERHLPPWAALRDFTAEVTVAIVDRRLTNAATFLPGVETLLLSTNPICEKVRSTSDALWVNTNFESWVKSTTRSGPPPAGLATACKYRIDNQFFLIGISFTNDQPISLKTPPGSDFASLELVKSGIAR